MEIEKLVTRATTIRNINRALSDNPYYTPSLRINYETLEQRENLISLKLDSDIAFMKLYIRSI